MTLSALLLRAASAAASVPSPPLYVDDDGIDCPGAPYSSIQAAIDSGAPAIHACAGEYTENLLINRALTLSGDGPELTRIHGLAGSAGPIISASNSVVTVRDLAVLGDSNLAGRRVYGVRFVEAGGSITNVHVRDIRDATGHAEGVGISLESSGAVVNLRVESNHVINATRVGILANGTGVNANILSNRVDGPSLPKRWAPNGIAVSRGASAFVSLNWVWNALSPAPDRGAASGIMSRCAGLTKIYRNFIYGADLGVSAVDAQNTWILGNEIYWSTADGISLQSVGNYFGDPGCPGGVQNTARNVVRDNVIDGSGGHGISIASYDPNFTVERNSIIANTAAYSGAEDMVDPTQGNAFARTRNWWAYNICQSSNPREICGY